jgi:hypothetical protein
MKLLTSTPAPIVKGFALGISLFGVATFLPLSLSSSDAAEKLGAGQESELWEEIANVRFQVAGGHDLQGETRKLGAFQARSLESPTTRGDEFDLAGDEKYMASEDYRTAAKHWEKAAKGYRSLGESEKARNAMENADSAWEASRRTLREGIEIHKMAQEYYATTNNVEKKTAVLGKIATSLERLMEMKR